MSDERTEPLKVPMIAATSMLRPPPARIGKISENFVLPRAIEAKKLFAGIAGAFFLLIPWLILWGPIFGFTLLSFLFALLIGAALGLAFVTLSPIRGESMYTYIQLRAQSRRGKWVELDGKPVKAFVGIAPLPFRALGRVRVLPGAVDVVAGSVDERGVPVARDAVRQALIDQHGVEAAAPSPFDGFSELRSLGEGSVLDEKPHRAIPSPVAVPPPSPFASAPPRNGGS